MKREMLTCQKVAAVLLLGAICAPTVCHADELPPEVRDLFESRCLNCHNDTDRKGDFSLQTAAALADSGYVIAADPDNSNLLDVVRSHDGDPPAMPRDAPPLSASELDVLERWIAAGAEWQGDNVLQLPSVSDYDWWSWQPLHRPDVPTFRKDSADAAWIQTPVDAFILKAQHERGLSHADAADRRQLIRRLTYDLTGLPPSTADVEAFVVDDQPAAWGQLIERLLASPGYGERWARHWLDVVKYADTHGYDKDKLRPNAWPYRDYVIRSFNQDKPWTQFIQEQIAGDTIYPGQPDGILGLGFLAAGPWDFIGHVEVPETKLDGQVARNLDRDDMVSNVLNSFCSVTVQCARCHNHKFDPITQEQYYGIQSVFAAVDRADRIYDTDAATEERRRTITEEVAKLEHSLADLDRQIHDRGGDALKKLNERIEDLKATANPVTKSPEFGYHSQITGSDEDTKWVEVDLGRDVLVSRIVLHPCHDDYAGIGSGFGFPLRYSVECRTSDTTAVDEPPELIATFADQDVTNPGLAPVSLSASDATVRYVRVTATRLAERRRDYMFALAELEVFDAKGENVALGVPVTAGDSIEAPPRWQKSNLTDGQWARPADLPLAAEFAAARQQQTKLIAMLTTEADQQQRREYESRLTDLRHQASSLPDGRLVFAAATHFSSQGNFKPTEGTPRDVRVLRRGEVSLPGKPALPGTIPISGQEPWTFELADDATESQRRAVLAQWVAGVDNPLTWRSMANRIWQYHFGTGLVESPNDFGRMGQPPTHPELLDWLADELRRTQSIKHLHRLILLSSTYQQSSDGDAENGVSDADNRFLWRMNRRRLSAEEIRDSILLISGKLNRKMGGPGFYVFELERTEHSPHYEYHKFDPNDSASHRRSIYRFIVRSQPDPFMTTFDCADSSQSTPRRAETQTALQSLSLLNNKFTLTMAPHFAGRVRDEGHDTPDQIRRAFQLTTGRRPAVDEFNVLSQYETRYGMINLCRALFNLNEFVFLD
jgi:Protein of unknown function (DUF1553)/Protein of unknown function (DUF1549)/Planctomycete cytochrome C